MNETIRERTTLLLQRFTAGDPTAEAELFEAVYNELRGLAGGQFRLQDPGHVLQPTALVNEAWLHLTDAAALDFQSRGHFYAFASRVMRSILVDHARALRAQKRGGDVQRVSLMEDEAEGETGPTEVDVLDLEQALTQLDEHDPDLLRVVELRFFGGMSNPEIAEVLGLALRTVERRWRFARVWLRDQLSK